MALTSVLLASCSTAGDDVPFGLSTADIAPAAEQQTDFAAATTNTVPVDATAFVSDENDPQLPDAVAAAPSVRPGSEQQVVAAEATTAAIPPQQMQPAEGTLNAQAAALEAANPTMPAPASAPAEANAVAAAVPQPTAAPEATAQAADTPAQPAQFIENQHTAPQVAAAEAPKKRGFLSSFFGTQARAAPSPQAARPLVAMAEPQKPLIAPSEPRQAAADPAPLVRLASTDPSGAGASALPGVRQNSLFEITRRSGLDDDSDIDVHEGDEDGYDIASAAGLARLAPNGLMKQTERVDVGCLKPSLVRTLKAVENHYGQKVIVTSGYRNPERNRKARGARNSLHMYCAAADIQVAGVDKWQLASFLRTMPGRGGIGTYCHTNSVHIDVGPERDWNWRCRRRK